ncbi:HAD family hydrolase [Segnochrobactrum spirostomi]|uniref:HAD family phosphatase n=1 Tax=Segnochrobactrum spirostomi TaxID=2608987 RepID=A0A6A7YCY8_9HYPH|nr:HAD family phosphatase [Segnochrobactrum spirostomi]MQT15269.1 HAD family phosphatase [Segnochrobactrum spirostomi]
MSLLAVAWDVDGTLIDSEPLHHEALVAVCGDFGADLSNVSGETFRGIHMGDVWTMLAPRLSPEADEATWLAAIIDYYVAHRDRLRPIPGALETMRALAARGIPQVCVSNSNRRIVDANVDALGVAPLLSFTISLDDVGAGKPDPEPYLTAATRLGLEPGRVLAVEDSRSGALSARAAGLFVAGYCPETGGVGEAHISLDRLEGVLELV